MVNWNYESKPIIFKLQERNIFKCMGLYFGYLRQRNISKCSNIVSFHYVWLMRLAGMTSCIVLCYIVAEEASYCSHCVMQTMGRAVLLCSLTFAAFFFEQPAAEHPVIMFLYE